jgi:hypothetical protein
VPTNKPGPHCCSSSTAPALCNFSICRACVAHGATCPIGGGAGSQTCCNPDDQCVADAVTAQVACNIPG